MTIQRVLVAAVVALSAALGTAHAGPAPRVMVIDRGGESLARKLRAELSYTGLQVVDPGPGDSASGEEDFVASSEGAALLRILSEHGVQVFISGTRVQEAYSQTLLARPGEEAFALRVVEELRARLVELGFELDDDSHPDEPAAKPVAPAIAVSAKPPQAIVSDGVTAPDEAAALPVGLWGTGGVGGIVAVGGLGPALAGVLGLRLEPGRALSLRLAALLPLSNNGTTAPEGEVEVSVMTFSLEAEHASQLGQGWLFGAGLGAGLVVLNMQSEAEAPFVGRDRTLVSGLYYAHVGLARAVTDWLRLRASLEVGLSGPRPVLRFDERDVASWGPGFGAFTLNTEIGWPITGGSAP